MFPRSPPDNDNCDAFSSRASDIASYEKHRVCICLFGRGEDFFPVYYGFLKCSRTSQGTLSAPRCGIKAKPDSAQGIFHFQSCWQKMAVRIANIAPPVRQIRLNIIKPEERLRFLEWSLRTLWAFPYGKNLFSLIQKKEPSQIILWLSMYFRRQQNIVVTSLNLQFESSGVVGIVGIPTLSQYCHFLQVS